MAVHKIVTNFVLTILIILLTSACGSSGNGDPSAANDQNVNSIEETTLHGSVGDGPVVGATISVYDKSGTLIGTQVSDGSAAYELTVRAPSRDYPLTIEASGGTDLVTGKAPDFTLKSVAFNPGKHKRVNINPYSTLIVETAKKMSSGINKSNIDTATGYVLDELNFGWDISLISDPVAGDITETNIAMVIKSSESLGEMIRRVRDNMAEASINLSGDEIISAISADIVDGSLDGLGFTGTSAHIAAVANIISAQILLEAMRNELRVNGADASTVMDDALSVTYPLTGSSTDNVNISQQAIHQARVTYNAVCEVDVNLDCTNRFLDLLSTNDTPQQAISIIPDSATNYVGNVVAIIVNGQAPQWETVNQIVRSENVGTSSVNSPPVISGTPPSSIMANSVYAFTPVASDADGDPLNFSISNLPGWASFDISTGALTGTPSDNDAGVYQNIVISVSDGTDTSALPGFSITVTANANGGAEFNFAYTSYSVNEGGIATVEITRNNSSGSATVSYSTYGISATQDQDYQGAVSTVVTFADGESSRTINIATNDDTIVENDETFQVVLLSPSLNYNLGAASSAVVTIRDNDVAINNPPTIAGNPSTSITANSPYSFTPTASDIDGDTLSFSITNKPNWASFNGSTGTLSGTPGDSDVGTYQNIVVSVSDGINTVSLAAFSITVTSSTPATGSATLSWSPPTENEDGSPLTDLAGYKIYYGTSPGVYETVISIDNPGIATYVVENLNTNTTYYFTMTSVNMLGIESAYSNSVSKIPQ